MGGVAGGWGQSCHVRWYVCEKMDRRARERLMSATVGYGLKMPAIVDSTYAMNSGSAQNRYATGPA